MQTMRRWLLLGSAILCFMVLLGSNVPSGRHGLFRVTPNSNLVKVLDGLQNQGLISSFYRPLYYLALRAFAMDRALKCGEYQIFATDSPLNIFKKIILGEFYYRRITIPEGLTTYQVIQLINQNDDLLGSISETYDESLLPETYSYKYCDHKSTMIEEMRVAMDRLLQSLWPARDAALAKYSMQEILTMASIIEKETALDEERPLIASVFFNRLARNMPLQADPTALYAVSEGKGYLSRPLERKDLAIDSPFNTYKYKGLPPGPICNPGRRSLEAALHPAVSNFLYFVRDPREAKHHFADNYKHHLKNVQNLRAFG